MLASISCTPFLSSVALIADFQASGSDPSGKMALRLSLGPTIRPVAVEDASRVLVTDARDLTKPTHRVGANGEESGLQGKKEQDEGKES